MDLQPGRWTSHAGGRPGMPGILGRPLPSIPGMSEASTAHRDRPTAGHAGGLAIPGWELVLRGKVRDLYRHPDHPGHLLLVATDRLSAFDVILRELVPDRGRVLTHVTEYWTRRVEDWLPAARVTTDVAAIPDLPAALNGVLRGRVTWTREAERLDVEIVLRARLAGSGWREYQRSGGLWGLPLPPGLRLGDPLPEVLLTPTTKSEEKDRPITWAEAVAIIGNEEDAERVRELALRLFREAAERAAAAGLVLADTKFEFGRLDGQVVLIDEVLTPDSSRYWPAAEIVPGQEPPSYDKEIVRSWLRSSGWDFQPPPPPLPAEVVERTRNRYLEVCRALTGGEPEGLGN